MPYDSDKQRRFMHVRHPDIASRWDEEIREKRKHQPSFGNGGKGHGRRQKEDNVAKAKKPFIGMKGTLESGERVSHGNRLPKYAKRKDFIGMKGKLDNGDYVSRGRRMDKDVGKSRFYDPESRRQRRLGMAEAALAGGAVAGTVLGVRGAAKTTKIVRGKHPNFVGSKAEVDALRQRVGHAVSAKPRELALLGGGAASGGGAFAVRRHAESRRGHPYN